MVSRKLTGSTESRGCNLDKDVVAVELVRLGSHVSFWEAILLTLEDGKGRHVDYDSSNGSDAETIGRVRSTMGEKRVGMKSYL